MPVFMANADRAGYEVLKYRGSRFPPRASSAFNMTTPDPVKASCSTTPVPPGHVDLLNRKEINDFVFFGMGKPMQTAILPPGGPCWDEAVAQKYADFESEAAKKLLDGTGMK